MSEDLALDPQEAALAAFFAEIQGLAGVKSFRNPDHDIQDSDCPAVVVVDGGDDVEEAETGRDRVVIRVTVALYVANAGGDIGPAMRELRRRVRDLFSAGRGGRRLPPPVIEVRYMGSADPYDMVRGETHIYTVWPLSFGLAVYEPA